MTDKRGKGERFEEVVDHFRDTLLPQLFERVGVLPGNLRAEILNITMFRAEFDALMSRESQDIQRRNRLVTSILDVVQKSLGSLPPDLKEIAQTTIAVRTRLGLYMSTPFAMAPTGPVEPHGESREFFQWQIAPVVAKINQEGNFDFSALPDDVKFELLFKPFEALAEKHKQKPTEATQLMDIKENRKAAAQALSNLLGIDIIRSNNIYSLVAKGNREKPGSLWKQYRP